MIKLRLFEAWEKFSFSVVGPAYRFLGKSMAQTGLQMQGALTSDDRLVPSLRRKPFKDIRPKIKDAKFIAPNAVIIGDVELGENSSIWYGSVVRGDRKKIKVGQHTVIQDLVSFVPTEDSHGIEIGDNVTIGPNALIQSGKVENYSFIGMGSTLRKGSKVESYGVVAAGSVLTENTVVPSYQIWAGNPAKYLRDLTNEEKQTLDEHHSELLDLARIHAEENEKSFREILNDKDREALYNSLSLEDTIALKMREMGLPVEAEDEENMEQRVFYKEYEPTESELWKKNYDIYEQDLFNFPDNFKIKGENYEQYEKLKKHFEDNPEEDIRLTEKFQQIPPKSDVPFTRKY